MRLTDDYQSCQTEEEEKQNTSKKPDKKEPPKKPTKVNRSNFNKRVNQKETGINSEIFQEYLSHQRPSDMLKDLYTTNDKYKNNGLVNVIKNGLSDFKNESKNISEKEKEIEKPNKIIDTVEEILEFNKQNQQGQGLKILTTAQILGRLPITLAQSKTSQPQKSTTCLQANKNRKMLVKNI